MSKIIVIALDKNNCIIFEKTSPTYYKFLSAELSSESTPFKTADSLLDSAGYKIEIIKKLGVISEKSYSPEEETIVLMATVSKLDKTNNLIKTEEINGRGLDYMIRSGTFKNESMLAAVTLLWSKTGLVLNIHSEEQNDSNRN